MDTFKMYKLAELLTISSSRCSKSRPASNFSRVFFGLPSKLTDGNLTQLRKCKTFLCIDEPAAVKMANLVPGSRFEFIWQDATPA